MKGRRFFTILWMIMMLALLAGCSNPGGQTLDEPDITVDYLSGEYAQQLIRDGAEYVLGTMEITTEEDGTTYLNIDAKELVEDESQPNGYYIADRNMDVKAPLAAEARTTFISGDMTIATVMTAEEFVAAVAEDLAQYGGEANPEYAQSKLYHVYVMNGQAELVLAQYLPGK